MKLTVSMMIVMNVLESWEPLSEIASPHRLSIRLC